MTEKLKRVLELANELQEAVNECADDVLSVTIRPGGVWETSGVHIYKLKPWDFDGMSFRKQDDNGNRWFSTDSYGVPVFGSVKGGDDQ